MTSRQRLLAALNREKPDRLPVVTHHLMPSFLEVCMPGCSALDFFDRFELDAVEWASALRPSRRGIELFERRESRDLKPIPAFFSSDWRIEGRNSQDQRFLTSTYEIHTPHKKLSFTLQADRHTSWVRERLIKDKNDIELMADYAPIPLCDVKSVNLQAERLGERGMIRGTVPGFDLYGQPGCWQDAAVLYGTMELIHQTFEDPQWVHDFLQILFERKKTYLASSRGARFDLLELGGGDASTTVISPHIFDKFVAPYDHDLIRVAHEAGQKIVYHTCGGMMPLLERIADLGADAAETFTPPAMGGDADLKEAKRRIGNSLCMIGGFDQVNFFTGCTPEDTRREVRRCFDAAGQGGGFILSPSDHFFEAEIELLDAFSDEAHRCTY